MPSGIRWSWTVNDRKQQEGNSRLLSLLDQKWLDSCPSPPSFRKHLLILVRYRFHADSDEEDEDEDFDLDPLESEQQRLEEEADDESALNPYRAAFESGYNRDLDHEAG